MAVQPRLYINILATAVKVQMFLARHTTANREFFARKKGPSVHEWIALVESGCVRGKIINGKPWIDLNHFAANDVLNPPSDITLASESGLSLLD